MKLKKYVLLATAITLSATMLTACRSSNDKSDAAVEKKSVDLDQISKDAVSKKSTVVNGKDMIEYTMSDGSVIQLPADGEMSGDSSGSTDSSSDSSSSSDSE